MSPPVFELTSGATALVISMPHSGTYLPPELAARMTAPAREVPDTDWFIPQLYDFAADIGASVLKATHSRYVVDLNRPPDGEPLYPGRRETGLCPLETFDAQALYRSGDEPSAAEIGERLKRFWRPYHEQLQELIGERIARHGRCLLWDAHSILSVVPGLFEGRLPDLNIGTADGRSCSPALAGRIVDALKAQTDFSVVLNGRFKGGYITRHYGRPEQGCDAVQLEISQSAYLHEARVPRFDAGRARPLQRVLHRVLSEILGAA